jgi:hypothetical protein
VTQLAFGQGTPGDGRAEAGFKALFNGKDLAGWDGDPRLWSVKDGAITGQSTRENPVRANTFLIWTNGTLKDFELRCSYRIVPNNNSGFGNSGIQYRSKVTNPSAWAAAGYQADLEAGPNYTGILYDEGGSRGIMANRGEKVVFHADGKREVTGQVGKAGEIQAGIRKEGWNEYVVIVRGNHLQHYVNGQQTVDVTDQDASKAAGSGVLALQMHTGEPFTVQFKDIRLKP